MNQSIETANKILTIISENLAVVPTTIKSIRDVLHDPSLTEAIALEIDKAVPMQELRKLRSYYDNIVSSVGHDNIIKEYNDRGELLRQEAQLRKTVQESNRVLLEELALMRGRLEEESMAHEKSMHREIQFLRSSSARSALERSIIGSLLNREYEEDLSDYETPLTERVRQFVKSVDEQVAVIQKQLK